MTALEIYRRAEKERIARGWSRADLDRKTWHAVGCWKNMGLRIVSGKSVNLATLSDYLEPLELEIVIRRAPNEGTN